MPSTIALIGATEFFVVFVVGGLFIAPFCLILRKAGYSPWLGLLLLIPGVNVILLWFVALARWPGSPDRAMGQGPRGPSVPAPGSTSVP